jgi:hypothetical protein
MKKLFTKLYIRETALKAGSFKNYCNSIKADIIMNKPEDIWFDNESVAIYYDGENVNECVSKIIKDECNNYVRILLKNYYAEELYLENLLDAILKGAIRDKNYDNESLSGHTSSYFKKDETLSYNEALADYEALKYSPKGHIMINKLKEIVGEDVVSIFEEHITRNRNKRRLKIKR